MKYRKKPIVIEAYQTKDPLDIETLEGVMHANAGDWIITGVNGETYPCKPDIFEKTYDEVNGDNMPFPIQHDHYRSNSGAMIHVPPCTIPWWLAEIAYEYYNKKYPGQSLDRLAARGGFGRAELVGLIRKEL